MVIGKADFKRNDKLRLIKALHFLWNQNKYCFGVVIYLVFIYLF